MGSSKEIGDLLREKFLYFHDNRTAWLYFVLKGKIVLDEFSAIAETSGGYSDPPLAFSLR